MPYADPIKQGEYLNAYHRKWRRENPERNNEYHRAWYKKNKQRERTRRSKRHRDEREAIRIPLWDAQSGRCAICGAPDPQDIDHNQLTRIVRGLLCHRCNLLLSGIESPRFHEKASAYLIHHENNPTGILYRLQRPHKKEIKKPK